MQQVETGAAAVSSAGILFRVERRFAKPREAVFRAWTDPDALVQWWCPAGWAPAEFEVDLRPGGQYRMGMRRDAGGAAVYVCGTFLAVDRPERVTYTWRWENAFERMPPTQVTVQFIADGAATILILTHGRIPDAAVCLQHRSGWLAALERLSRVL